jgi:hypothetical protein
MVTRPVGYVEGPRQHVGHAPVIMTCAACAVLDDAGRVLLQRRGDPVARGGCPGARWSSARRWRRRGLDVRPDELLGVHTGPLHTYANRDVVQAVVVVLTATQVAGRLSVDGTETVDLGWHALDALPTPVFGPHEPMLQDRRRGRRGRWV